MLENETCPHCGSHDGLFVCSFMAVNCSNCGQYVRPLTKEEIENLLEKLKRRGI